MNQIYKIQTDNYTDYTMFKGHLIKLPKLEKCQVKYIDIIIYGKWLLIEYKNKLTQDEIKNMLKDKLVDIYLQKGLNTKQIVKEIKIVNQLISEM